MKNRMFSDSMNNTDSGYGGAGYYDGKIARTTFTYGSGGPDNYSYAYQYDNLGRLLRAQNTASAQYSYGTTANDSIQYDLNGNITYLKRGLAAGKTYTYYTGKNSVQTKTTGAEYTYDVTGNMLSSTPMGITLASYDPFTELVMKEKKSSTDSTLFEYGGAKQRALKTGVSTGSTLYIHGLSEYPLMEKTTSGTEQM